jgi:hypothetical protein
MYRGYASAPLVFVFDLIACCVYSTHFIFNGLKSVATKCIEATPLPQLYLYLIELPAAFLSLILFFNGLKSVATKCTEATPLPNLCLYLI